MLPGFDAIPPSWRLHLFQADTVFGQPMSDQMNMGTPSAPLLTPHPLPQRIGRIGAGVLRVQATALGVVASDWYLALFDGDEVDSGGDPAGRPILQLGTADGTESVPPTVAILHLEEGQLGRLSYFAVNTSGNGFGFLLDFWTYDAIEAWHRRVMGLPAVVKPGPCGC